MGNYRDYLIDQLIAQAATEISSKGFSGKIVTLALYFDHEGAALSVFADTLENSLAKQEQSRTWSHQHLSAAIDAGDLEKAARFNHNVSRNLSLGDFFLRGLAVYELEPDDENSDMPQSFFVSLAQGLQRNSSICISVCDPEQPMVLACSTANDELGLVWTPPRD